MRSGLSHKEDSRDRFCLSKLVGGLSEDDQQLSAIVEVGREEMNAMIYTGATASFIS